MKKHLKNIAVSVTICLVVTLLLALTNELTAPIIEQNQNAAANAALLEVMPEGKGFETVDLSTFELPATVTEVHKETEGLGYVIKLTTNGYGSDMVIMCGVDASGVVQGAVCLSSNETLGKEKTYGDNFTGQNADGVETVDVIAGATKTTEAYKNAVKDALNAAIILSGGSVDIRTEEQILADNLAAALPAGEGAFTKVFLTEAVSGIDAVYAADNASGYVCVVGEQFIGTDANGTVLRSDVADAQAVTDAITAVVLGGTPFTGGSGSVATSFIGAFVLITLTNALVILGVPTTAQTIVKGVVVIAAVAISTSNISLKKKK